MLDTIDKQIITAMQDGLDLTPQPYQSIAKIINQTEAVVIQRLKLLQENGTIKRLGVIVKHRALGFKANAMVVWNIPDSQVKKIAQLLAAFDCITLCYQRPRRLPDWPYNLFTMIHGKDRASVLERLSHIIEILDMQNIQQQVLFSTKQFKQRGGHYLNVPTTNIQTAKDNVINFPSPQVSNKTTDKTENIPVTHYTSLLKPIYG